jgi:Tol biopolymer transport system component
MKSHTEGEGSEIAIETIPREGGSTGKILSMSGLGSFCWAADGHIIYSSEEPPSNGKGMNLWEVQVSEAGTTSGQPRRITNWAGLSLLDLSISEDSKRLVFVNSGLQQDLYVAGVGSEGTLGLPRKLTLEGKNDLPSAWTPDGQTLFLYSDRNGNWDIFKQHLGDRKAQEFILGPGDQTDPRLTPGASWVLYWDHVEAGGKTTPFRLLRVPISGGAPERVLETTRGAAVRCPFTRSLCVLSEHDQLTGKLVFSAFDPVQGRRAQIFSLATDPAASPAWDLSPDGSTVAVVSLDEVKDRIRMVHVQTGSTRSISVGDTANLSGITWSADGRSWFITSSSVRGAALLRVGANGETSDLWKTTNTVGSPVASPDGRNLAFTVSTHNSNAWMIENF